MTGGSAYLSGYSDSLTFIPTLSADGRTLTGTVSHPALANRDFRCVLNSYGFGDDYRYDNVASAWFGGYEPPPPPPPPPPLPPPPPPPPPPPTVSVYSATATAHADQYLASRFGTSWTATKKRWLKCPKEALIKEAGQPPRLLCSFDFAEGGAYRGGGFLVRLNRRTNSLVVENFSSRRYSKRITRCASRYTPDTTLHRGANRYPVSNRKLTAQRGSCEFIGTVRTSDLDVAAVRRFPGALSRATVYMGGTNTAVGSLSRSGTRALSVRAPTGRSGGTRSTASMGSATASAMRSRSLA